MNTFSIVYVNMYKNMKNIKNNKNKNCKQNMKDKNFKVI